MKRILLFLLLIGLILTVTPTNETKALSGSEFQAGRIIDDGVFFNGNGLDPGQIQNFLNSKVPNCDTWHAKSSHPRDTGPPYTCLKNYQETTWDIPADAYCNGFWGGNKSSMQIIYDVAISCGVSPKVILVTLQKEQSFITDTWPRNIEYEKAMGYRCPDTALPLSQDSNQNGCYDDSEGFFRQVYYGTRQFKRYAQDSHIFTSYRPYRTNYIQYNPNPGCSGTNVYIQNQATSGLYIYTPYQPNAAALSNLYGTGDGCSAYGNRNFWRMFNDWFGTTHAGAFNARIVEHSAYPSIKPGQSASIYAKFQNSGNSAWYDDIGAASVPGERPVRLATDLPLNRYSPLGGNWAYPHRPGINFARVYNASGGLTPNQHVAYPGEIVEFWFAYTAPPNLTPGKYVEGFRPIVEGMGPMNDTGSFIVVDIQQPVYSAAIAGQTNPPSLKQGEKSTASLSYKNTGNMTWHDETSAYVANQLPVHLATDYPLNRASAFSNKWPWAHRSNINFTAVYEANGTTLAANQHKVEPGQIAKFSFDISVPTHQKPGFYGEALRPIVQGLGPMNDTGTWIGVNVQQASYIAEYAGQSGAISVNKGQSADGFIMYKNNGNIAWHDEASAWVNDRAPVRLATDYPLNRSSAFGSTWAARHRPGYYFAAVYEADKITLAANQHVVQPGQVVKFNIKFTAASSQPAGFYGEAVRLIVEGVGPMNDTGTWLGVTVNP